MGYQEVGLKRNSVIDSVLIVIDHLKVDFTLKNELLTLLASTINSNLGDCIN